MAMFRCLGLLAFMLTWMCWVANSQQGGGDPEDPTNPHRDPSKCEVCKLMAIELQGMMDDTGKTREVLELGYRIDQKHKRIPYKFSELRLIESLEGVCDRIMEYNIHAERQNSRRFAKGMSETFQTLHGLVNKGVKVELGIPYNMWDEPSAPVHTLRKLCDQIVEEHEESIENWFRGDQEKTLTSYLCAERVLTREESEECLGEEWTGVERVVHNTEEEKDESEKSENGEENDDEDDPEKKKQAELDRQKVQREIERQAKEQQNQQEQDEEKEKQRERDMKKREREMERRRREREREDRDGDRKMNREREDRRKVEL